MKLIRILIRAIKLYFQKPIAVIGLDEKEINTILRKAYLWLHDNDCDEEMKQRRKEFEAKKHYQGTYEYAYEKSCTTGKRDIVKGLSEFDIPFDAQTLGAIFAKQEWEAHNERFLKKLKIGHISRYLDQVIKWRTDLTQLGKTEIIETVCRFLAVIPKEQLFKMIIDDEIENALYEDRRR